jgi:DNA-binding NtrC family response regulator
MMENKQNGTGSRDIPLAHGGIMNATESLVEFESNGEKGSYPLFPAWLFGSLESAPLKQNLDSAMGNAVKAYLRLTCAGEAVPLRLFVSDFERYIIGLALEVTGGSQKNACRLLGIKENVLSIKVKKYGLKKNEGGLHRVRMSSADRA